MSGRHAETRVSARLVRLLNMVPYFIANPGISAAEASEELGVSPKDLMRDLNQLWVCGLPGYGPGDLIDLAFSEASIEVTFSAGIDRPLRLTSTEATALLVALKSLVGQPGMVDPEAARRAIAKIDAAAGAARGGEADPVLDAVEEEPDADPSGPVATTVREALRDGKALWLRYYSASRDAQTERVVDPVQVVYFEGNGYVQAWCRAAAAVRMFRFDRVEAAAVLDEPSRPPASARAEVPPGLLGDDAALPVAVLQVEPGALWALDYYPIEPSQDAGDPDAPGAAAPGAHGAVVGQMRFASYDWMARLVLGFGGAMRVLAPAELADLVRSRAQAALASYGSQAVRTDFTAS